MIAWQELAMRPCLRLASLAASREQMAHYEALLTDEEESRAQRFMQPSDRQRFVLGRGALRALLADELGIARHQSVFDPDERGKPHLRGRPEVAISISHSGDLVLVAAGIGMALGVDVERHREDARLDGVSSIVFAACEIEALNSGPRDTHAERFFRQWTMKEAIVKALGTGLLLEPRRFAIEICAGVATVRFLGRGPDDVGHGWSVEDFKVPAGYSAALAWRKLV